MVTKAKPRRKNERNDGPYKKLRADLKAGTAGGVYIFHGEETYLRQDSVAKLRALLVPEGCEEFNYHPLEGKGLQVQALVEMAEAMPMMAENTLITVTDCDIFKLPADQRDRLTEFLNDVPPYCCLVFIYDTIPYKPNGSMRKLTAAIKKYVEVVEFLDSEDGPLLNWIRLHFQDMGKDIRRSEAQYLIFTCGRLMAGLLPEIEKIGAYAKGDFITREDIDAVASPILEAELFKMIDAVAGRNWDQAARLLGNLLALKTEPVQILYNLGMQLRQLWYARIALDRGWSSDKLASVCGMHSYRAKLTMQAARRADPLWCREAVRQCQILDRRMKSERGADGNAELKLLLARLGVGR